MGDDLAAEIKRFALGELGFTLAGITTASPPPEGARLAEWLARGHHGTMTYLESTAAVRCDPRRFLPGARSVVCVALSCLDDAAAPAGDDGDVVVAAYARRPDYHGVIRRLLVRLGRFLSERVPGAAWRPAVDTAPLLEKALAQRAGLGWTGKHTCLVNRTYGGRLLLGEVVTDLDLPSDPPEPDRCGDCRACLDACPTGALIGPRWLDARRCLAYATVEHSGPFPPHLIPAVGNRLFGCDVCQDVCPWHHSARPGCPPALAPLPRLAALHRARLEETGAPGWARLAAGTPLRRLDIARLRRNLAALASARSPGGPAGKTTGRT